MTEQPNSIGPFDNVPTRPIEHDPELLALMLADMKTQKAVWRPTRYWMNYVAAKSSAFSAERMAKLRREFKILEGFAQAGPIRPALPLATWKRSVWFLVEHLPIVRRVIADYQHALRSQFSVGRRAINGRAILALNLVASCFPDLRIPAGQTNGAPLDLVQWRDQYVAAEFADYLMRVADLYREMDATEIESVVEIGPGLGWTTLAHLSLNPNIKTIINIDIPPTLYVSTQFLKSMPELEVFDYRFTRDMQSISFNKQSDKLAVYQIAPWQVPNLEGPIDLLANAFSFFEMELEVCRNYATHLTPLVEKGVLLHSTPTGKQMSHGPAQAISMDFLAGLFSEKFPQRKTLERYWNEVYGRFSTTVALLTR